MSEMKRLAVMALYLLLFCRPMSVGQEFPRPEDKTSHTQLKASKNGEISKKQGAPPKSTPAPVKRQIAPSAEPCKEKGYSKKEDSQAEPRGWFKAYVILTGVIAVCSLFATLATGASARTAKESARLARQALWVAERAYVNLKGFTVQNFEPGRSPLVIIQIINAGRTPAYITKSSLFASICPGPLPQQPAYPPDDIPGIPAVLVAGEFIESRLRLTIDLSPDRFAQLQKGIGMVLIFGKIEYSDVFGNPHKTGFARRSDFQGAATTGMLWIYPELPGYNYAD